MNDKEKRNSLIKFYSKYENTCVQIPKNKYINENESHNNKSNSKKNNINIHSNNKTSFQKRYNKTIITDNKKENKILDNYTNEEETIMNNSVNINNINLINSMNNITYYDSSKNNKMNLKKYNNITVNKKINNIKNKKYENKEILTEFNYKNFGINIAVKGLKENNINKNVERRMKVKNTNINDINYNRNIINNSLNNKFSQINVNKLSQKKIENLKISPNSTSNIFSLLSNKRNNKNNYINKSPVLNINNKDNYSHFKSPKNVRFNLNLNKPKSEEKNMKKINKVNSISSKKYKKKNKKNIYISNYDNRINNILISGNNTTKNSNYNKKYLLNTKSKEKINKKLNQKNKKINTNSNLNTNSNIINNINSFDKIEVNKKTFMKNYLLSKNKEKDKKFHDIEKRNDSFNLYLKRTHQNSWTNSIEKDNSNLILYKNNEKDEKNIKLEKNKENISSKLIYNKKQLSIHNKKQSFYDIINILSPLSQTDKKKIFSDNFENSYNYNSNYEENNLKLNDDLICRKKILLNNIYKKPDISFNNNSFLLIGKDALINKNNTNNTNKISLYSNMILKEENKKRKYNVKLNKYLRQNEIISDNNKDKNELSILLNSENNNNSKEITMDTNFNLNEISIITKINNKVLNNNNFIIKYFSYFIQNNKTKQPCFITKTRTNKNNYKIKKIPKKMKCFISKTRKIYCNIIPKINICYFSKEINIDSNNLNYMIKPILTERTTIKENDFYKYNNKVIKTTKKIVNIEKYDNNIANKNNLKKTEKGLKLLEKIADKRISLSSILVKKSKKIFVIINNFNSNKNIKNDFIENLNKITNSNYEIILNKISDLLLKDNKSSNINISKIINNQNDLIEIIIEKGMKEKKYIKLYAKLCQDLFINIITMIDCNINDIDIFNKISKEKSFKNIMKIKIIKKLENGNNDYKILFYFICELFKTKILSIKKGFEILDLLFSRYIKDLNIKDLEGIEILLRNMKNIVYEKNNLEYIQRYNRYIKNNLYNIFQNNKKRNGLPNYLYYKMYNLLQNKNKEIIIINQEYNKNIEMIKSDLNSFINNNNINNNLLLLELNNKYDIELNKNKSFELWEFLYNYIEVCIDIINKQKKIKFANEYINNFINNFLTSIPNEVWEILHYKLISLFLNINDICVDNIYMYQIMGFFLYALINNKLFYIKDLNNFLEKENFVIINIAKVVKYTIIFAEKNAKKFHNDFKQTKLFFGNDIFYNLVTVPLKKNFYEI